MTVIIVISSDSRVKMGWGESHCEHPPGSLGGPCLV